MNCIYMTIVRNVAIDTLLGKQSLIIKMKTMVVTKMSIAIFRLNHKSFSSKEKLGKKEIRQLSKEMLLSFYINC